MGVREESVWTAREAKVATGDRETGQGEARERELTSDSSSSMSTADELADGW